MAVQSFQLVWRSGARIGGTFKNAAQVITRSAQAIKAGLSPHPDHAFLSHRLRKDVGLDELELERARVERAPLIKDRPAQT